MSRDLAQILLKNIRIAEAGLVLIMIPAHVNEVCILRSSTLMSKSKLDFRIISQSDCLTSGVKPADNFQYLMQILNL